MKLVFEPTQSALSRFPWLPGPLIAAVLGVVFSATVPGAAAPTAPSEILLLGPLEAPPVVDATSRLAPTIDLIPEIDPVFADPAIGQSVSLWPGASKKWTAVETGGAEQGVLLESAGVYWLATNVLADRYAEVQVRCRTRGRVAIHVDGALESEETATSKDSPISAEVELRRGWHRILVRVAIDDEDGVPGSIALDLEPSHGATLRYATRAPTTLADLDRSRHLPLLGSIVLNPRGTVLARRLTRRNAVGSGSRSAISLWTGKGELIRDEVGGEKAAPVSFSPDGKYLLVRRPGVDGTDLVLLDPVTSQTRVVVRDESGLAWARFSPDGQFLLLLSSEGASEDEADDTDPIRQLALRETVPDYSTQPHLHLVDVRSSARTRLTSPGDWVLDDAVFSADGRTVIYGKTVPRPERPYFHTEIREIDLSTRKDRLVSIFVGGWEVRPQRFTVSPDGKELAFIGPPEEIGSGQAEHNVYHYQIYLLSLAGGEMKRISTEMSYAFGAGGANTLSFGTSKDVLFACAQDGAATRLVKIERQPDGTWSARPIAQDNDSIRGVAFSQDRSTAAYVLSGRTRTDTLVVLDLDDGARTVIEAPDSGPVDRWSFAEPVELPYRGPGGETLEGWWYPPLMKADEGKTPLIVYYYGGASPTARSLSGFHQMFAANGYALLVLNPRGSTGRGEAFADHHVGDWGTKSAADVLAGVDALLAEHPEIDAERIGIYGGSYGGFLTQYLITESDRFAAAVSMYGISDLTSYWGQGAWGWTYGDMAGGGATPWKDPRIFVQQSPIFRADRINTPLLLLHGLSDTNVTPGESVQLFTALKVQNKDVEMVLFPGENHGLSSTFEKRVDHRTMVLDWFDKILRRQPMAWSARFP